MKCPGLIVFSTSRKQGQFVIISYGEYTPESSVSLKVQYVLSAQENLSGWVVVGIAGAVKTQSLLGWYIRFYSMASKKDLRPGP